MASGGYKRSKEHGQKISKANKGRIFSEEHRKNLSKSLKGKKHSEEFKKHLSEILKGKPTWNKGKHLSEKHKRKISEAQKGRKYPKKSEQAKKRRGPKSSNWKGGITLLTHRIRASEKYQKWRTDCFIRDFFTCQKCGDKGIYLVVHHKKPFYKFLIEVKKYLPLFDLYEGAMLYNPLWDLNNGITLCKRCHIVRKKEKKNESGGI